MVPRLIEAYVTYIGALKAGLVVIPSSEMLRPSDIDYRLVHSNAKAIVSYDAFSSQFNDVENMEGVQHFVIGKAEKTKIITDLLKHASTDFAQLKQKVLTLHSYRILQEQQERQRELYIHMLGLRSFKNYWGKVAWY